MKQTRISPDLKISLLYVLLGGAWILLSDSLLAALIPDPAALTRLQTYKGWMFVAISALVIYLLLRQEERLRAETEDRYRLIVETAQEGIWVIDAESRTTFVNRKLAEMLGYTVEEMSGAPLFSFMDEQGQGIASANLERRRQGIKEQHDFKFRRKDGSDLWAILETNPITGRDGQYVGALAMMTDITGRKQAEQEVIATRDRLQRVLDGINDGFVTFDPQLNYTYVNPRAGEMLGRKPEELIGKNYWEEYPEAKGTPFANAYQKALETQEPLVIEDHYLPWDRWFENRIHPSQDGLSVFFTEITERKRAEEALRIAHERTRRIIDANIMGVALASPTGKVLEANDYYLHTIGYTRQEFENGLVDWRSITPPEWLSVDERAIQELRERGVCTPYEKEYLRRDGTRVSVFLSDAMLPGPEEQIVAIVLDISGRKQVERVIQSERDFSERALNSLPGVFYMYDEDRKFLRWNRNFETVTGYSGEEIARMNPLDFFTGGEKNLLAERIQEVFTTGVSAVEADFVSKDGARTPYYFTGHTIDLDGKKCLIGVGIDISERKLAEQALQRNEQILRLFVEHSPASIAMFDRDMNYIVASRRYLLDYDLGDQNVVGRSHYEVFPEIPERWREIHQRCLAGGVERAEEDPFPRISGKMDWIRWEIRPWYEANEEIGGVILFSEVVTGRKRAEDELRLHRDRLAELTRRLVETQEAERRAIGRELHDQFGQMLTAMKITLDIARQLPPEAAARKIAQAQETATDLLNRTSRLSLELRPPMLDDLGIIPALIWQVNRYQEQTGIPVQFRHSGVENRRFNPEIETTAYRIVQEALTNVARHARANGIRLEVHARGDWLEIRLEDDGIGFDPQEAMTQNRGLSGMKERAQLVGGEFQVESQPGRGTRKLIRLPIREETS